MAEISEADFLEGRDNWRERYGGSDLIPDEKRKRIAAFDSQIIRGVGIVDDVNGPFMLRFKIDGIAQLVTLDTSKWNVEWADDARVSPVTREALGRTVLDAIEATRQLDVEDETTRQIASQIADAVLALLSVSPPAEVTDAMVERGARKISKCLEFRPDLCDGCARRLAESRAVFEAALGVLPAEVEWEYGEFSKDDIQEDGSIHPWAEPLDTWETPLTGDDLSDLADVGSVCAHRVKAGPWVPVSPESEGKK